MKNLLVLTTAGRLHFLRDAITTLRDPLDVLVVDDATPEKVGIGAFCKKRGLNFITKKKPRGLTHSWNVAWRFFRDNDYGAVILSNDDVRFAKGFSGSLLRGAKKFSFVCPVSNLPTRNPKFFPRQWLHRYTDMVPTAKGNNRDAVQELLSKKFRRKPYLVTNGFNGFCFAFNKNASKFGVSEDFLFNGYVNTKNEILLCHRVAKRHGSIAVCLRSYVFHWKRGTYGELRLKHSNQLWTASRTPIGK